MNCSGRRLHVYVVTFSLLMRGTSTAYQFASFLSSCRDLSKGTHIDSIQSPVASRRKNYRKPWNLMVVATDEEASSEEVKRAENDDTSNKLFDTDTWEAYESAIRGVMTSKRVLKKIKATDIRPVEDFLLCNRKLISIITPSMSGKEFQDDLKEQKNQFMEKYALSREQYEFAMRCLVYMGDFCAKAQNPIPIVVTWHKVKESGMLLQAGSISTYMYVLGLNESFNDLLVEMATCHDILFGPNERTIMLRTKSLIANNDPVGAEQLLALLPDDGTDGSCKKLRTFLPLVEHYFAVGDTSSVLRLFRQMQNSPSVYFDTETYALVLGTLAKCGSFRIDATPVDGAEDAGFSSHGPGLFDEIASEMAEDKMEITEKAAKVIYDSFVHGFSLNSTLECEDKNVTLDFEIPILNESDADIVSPDNREALVGRVVIDDSTAMCHATKSKLRLFRLNEDQRKHVHDTLLEMAQIQHQEFSSKKKRAVQSDDNDDADIDHGLKQLSIFSEWLDTREGEPFTAVVDGANVAYFGSPRVYYNQVKLVVDELERMGENPLVTMPQKYVSNKFRLSHGKIQELSKDEVSIMNGLVDADKMYIVPFLCLDDYYWMLASVSNQTNARQQNDLRVSSADAAGRFPGLRPLLITNDQMRDHKLELLEPREFRRWCSCHIVNYNVSPPSGDDCDNMEVKFYPADFFSREIQGNPPGKRGDGLVWHFPVTEWEEHEYFCIFITR